MSRSELRMRSAGGVAEDAPERVLEGVLRTAATMGSSDIHFSADAPALHRHDGHLVPVPGYDSPIPGPVLLDALVGIMSAAHREGFHRRWTSSPQKIPVVAPACGRTPHKTKRAVCSNEGGVSWVEHIVSYPEHP